MNSLGRTAACDCPLADWWAMLCTGACCRCRPTTMGAEGRGRAVAEAPSPQASCPMTTSTPRFLSFFFSVFCLFFFIAVLPWKDLDWPGKCPFSSWWKFIQVCVPQFSPRKNQRIFFLSDLEIRFQGSLKGFLMGFDFLPQLWIQKEAICPRTNQRQCPWRRIRP